MRGSFNIAIQSDGGWTRTLRFTRAGVVYPLTTVVLATLTITPRGASPVVLSIANSHAVLDGAAGTITFRMTQSEVAAFTWTTGKFEIVITRSDPYDEGIQFNGQVAIV